jgi:hypothetical protein
MFNPFSFIVWFDISNPENYLALAMPTVKRAENDAKSHVLHPDGAGG